MSEVKRMEPLKKYQAKCVDRGRTKSQGLFLEMGLGKTRVALECIPYENGLNVVCCSAKGVKGTWENEGEKWRPDIHIITTIGLGPKGRKEQRRCAADRMGIEPVILLINFEQAMETAKWLGEKNVRLFVAIADESTYIKSHNAQRTKGMNGYKDQRMKQRVKGVRDFADMGYALTGTPVLQGPIDLYSQLRFVDESIFPESYWSFRNKYARMGGYLKKQIVGYKNMKDLMERIKPWVISLKKADVAPELPPKIYVTREVELTLNERRNYKTIKEDSILELPKGDFVPLVNALSRLTKLMQATSGFNYVPLLSGQRSAIEHGKTKREAVVDLITEGDLTAQPVIIWSSFTHEIKMISNDLATPSMGRKGVWVASRHTHHADELAVEAFLQNRANVLILNPASMGHGINLQRATAQIFMSNSFKYGDREQAEARCHRIGQKFPVTIIDIVAKGTVDEKVLRVLSKKATIAEAITNELGVSVQEKAVVDFNMEGGD